MDVSIVIVNYRTISLVVDCIKSIIGHTTGISYEIIVVDNHSGDDCERTFAREFGTSNNIIFIELPENVGFGQGNNAGFKVAKGRNIICLNPDTVLLNNALKLLSDHLDNNPKVGICGGNLYDEEMKPTLSYMTFTPSILFELDELTHGWLSRRKNGKSSKFNYTGNIKSVGYITGADMMVKRSVLERSGDFSPAFFMYYEETELTYRIKKLGYLVHSVPMAKIQHLEGKSFQPLVVNERQVRMSEQGRQTYYKLHYSLPYRIIANTIYGIFLLSRYIIFKIKGNNRDLLYRCRLRSFYII